MTVMTQIGNDGLVRVYSGIPRDIGYAYGEANCVLIRNDTTKWHNHMRRDEGWSTSDFRNNIRRFLELVGTMAPWWFEEMDAMAEAAGVDPEVFRWYTALRRLEKAEWYVANSSYATCGREEDEECTSCLAVGDSVSDRRSILHKNRDHSAGRLQGLWIKERKVQGQQLHRFVGVSDVSDFGVTAFLNSAGVAGVMNAGEAYPDPCLVGLTTPTILLLIAERASCVEDALCILEDILSQRDSYTNGEKGSIWLFVDADKGLIVEHTSRVLAHKFIYSDTEARANDFILLDRQATVDSKGSERPGGLVRREILIKHLQAWSGAITPSFINCLFRDMSPAQRGLVSLYDETGRGHAWGQMVNCLTDDQRNAHFFSRVCKPGTRYGFTAVISPEYKDILSYALVSIGHPGSCAYLPVFIGANGLSRPLADGSLDVAARSVAHRNTWGLTPDRSLYTLLSAEAEFSEEVAELDRRAREMLIAGYTSEVREVVTSHPAVMASRLLGHYQTMAAAPSLPQP